MKRNLRMMVVAAVMLCSLCAVAQVRGDVTGDGTVDVSDVNTVVNIILGKAQAADFPGNADCNGDGIVDVSDVNIVVNIILGKDVPPIPTSTTFKRITSADQLVAGKRYLIICETYEGAMGGKMPGYENYRALVSDGITLSNGTATVEDGSSVSIFALGGSSSSWTFYDGTYYLANSNSSQLNSVETVADNSAKWTISFNGNNATITNKKNTSKTIYYQPSYSDFNASASGTAVQLYVEDDGSSPITTVAVPTFSPEAGSYNTPQTVTITTATSGATIYYTTDGSTPSSSSTLYTSAITITATTTIRAIAILNGISSDVATATFTIIDNNVNANWRETSYNIPESSANATTSSATYGMAWRLEYPHIRPDNNSTVVVHASSDYGISYSLELDKAQRANRWSCFSMHDGTPNNNVGRVTSTFSPESCVEPAYQVSTSEYTNGHYTQSSINLDGKNMTTFSRGHICASEDRQSSEDQNLYTFITSNCHPQYQAHNAGLWSRMESQVQTWGYSSSFRDTMYVCKGATIANVTLNGTTSNGTISAEEVENLYGVEITGSLVIPRYWFMAILCFKNGQYHAMAYWTEQINSACSSTTPSSCMITIDELEARTGIDFFCNLPDDIESVVEATLENNFWR